MSGNAQIQSPRTSELKTDKGSAAIVMEGEVSSPFVVVCEHAGQLIPQALENLGLSEAELHSHVAWDPGAREVAEHLARALKGTLIKQRYSRLVYDCNRPSSSRDAMRDISENTVIPGNRNLSDDEKNWRIENIYKAFHDCVSSHLEKRELPVLITVHSFTPVFHGATRVVDVGVLHGKDSRLADAILTFAQFDEGINVRRNEPYGPVDGVTHTLQIHSNWDEPASGILNVMIEIKNTLIADDKSQRHYGEQLAQTIKRAVNSLNTGQNTGE